MFAERGTSQDYFAPVGSTILHKNGASCSRAAGISSKKKKPLQVNVRRDSADGGERSEGRLKCSCTAVSEENEGVKRKRLLFLFPLFNVAPCEGESRATVQSFGIKLNHSVVQTPKHCVTQREETKHTRSSILSFTASCHPPPPHMSM